METSIVVILINEKKCTLHYNRDNFTMSVDATTFKINFKLNLSLLVSK